MGKLGGQSTQAITKPDGCASLPDVEITDAEGQEVNHFSNHSDHNMDLVRESVKMSPQEHFRRLQIGQIPMSSTHTRYKNLLGMMRMMKAVTWYRGSKNSMVIFWRRRGSRDLSIDLFW